MDGYNLYYKSYDSYLALQNPGVELNLTSLGKSVFNVEIPLIILL